MAESQQEPNIIIEPAQMAGVWANWARVSHSPFEFTLDFVRMDFAEQPPNVNGIVVARVSVSPLFVTQLIEALTQNWDKYAEKAMPKELTGGETDEDDRGDPSPD